MRLYQIEEDNTMDHATGEATGTTEIKRQGIVKSDEPHYVKLYLDHLIEFAGGLKTASNLALEFAKIMSYESDSTGTDLNMIYTNSTFISNYCNKYHITRDAYNKQLRSLIDSNIIRRVNRGTFQMNPNLMAKGDWMKNGIKTLRATFDYVTGEVITDIEAKDPEDVQ